MDLGNNRFSDSSANFPLDNPAAGTIGLLGLWVQPNLSYKFYYPVLSNDATSITVSNWDNSFAAVAQPGATYRGATVLNNVHVTGNAAASSNGTLVILNGALTQDAGGVWTGPVELDTQINSKISLSQVAAPVFTPAAGTYTSAQSVTITSATPGASIVYTTDGSTPTESNGSVTHGTLLSNGGSVSVSTSTILNAIAFGPGPDSPDVSATYAINSVTTGLLLWLRADSIAGPGPVSTWLDQSGNGNNVSQSTGGSQPTLVTDSTVLNGLPMVHFNGSSQYLLGNTTSLFQPTNITVIAVYRLATGGHYPRIIGQPYAASGWNPPWVSWYLTAGLDGTGQPQAGIGVGNTYDLITGNTSYLGAFGVLAMTYDGQDETLYLNGISQGVLPVTGPIPYNGANNFYIGSDPNNGNDYFDGDMAELIVYDHALSAAEMNTVNAYLNYKYNLF